MKKQKKSSAPTDDDIKNYLKDILKEANLEEITMKTVCKKVYAKYPQHDLSHKKDFIKQTVKSVRRKLKNIYLMLLNFFLNFS
jgi:protein DEK